MPAPPSGKQPHLRWLPAAQIRVPAGRKHHRGAPITSRGGPGPRSEKSGRSSSTGPRPAQSQAAPSPRPSQPMGSVLVSFTPVRRRSLVVTPIVFAQAMDGGGRH
jgi:hypothetical protein